MRNKKRTKLGFGNARFTCEDTDEGSNVGGLQSFGSGTIIELSHTQHHLESTKEVDLP